MVGCKRKQITVCVSLWIVATVLFELYMTLQVLVLVKCLDWYSDDWTVDQIDLSPGLFYIFEILNDNF